MAERNAIIAIKEVDGQLQILDAMSQVHTCANTPAGAWEVIQRVLADESLPSVQSRPRPRTNGESHEDRFTAKKEEEHIRNIANAALGQMGPVAQAAAPLLVSRLGKFLRKVSR